MTVELYGIGSEVYCIETVCQWDKSEYCRMMMKHGVSCDRCKRSRYAAIKHRVFGIEIADRSVYYQTDGCGSFHENDVFEYVCLAIEEATRRNNAAGK